MSAYERRGAPAQGERPSRPFGRAMSLGRWESDRSIEDRYGRGYEGDPLAISDFFRYGRERYNRPAGYDKMEAYRRTAHHRSQSLARLDSQRFSDDRPAYQGRFDDGFERYPRDFIEDRYARDYPEDRFTGSYYGRQYFDDRAFYPAERFIYERPPFDRYGYDRYVFERPAGDRMFGERFYERHGPEDRSDRFNRGERFDADRHQEQQQRYGGKENRVERFDGDRHQEQQQRYAGRENRAERFDVDRSIENQQHSRNVKEGHKYHDRYERHTIGADRYRQGRSQRQDQRHEHYSDEQRKERAQGEKRNGRYRAEHQNSSPDRERKYSDDQERKYSDERERKYSDERERKYSDEREAETKRSGDRERPTIDCTERFRKI